jgi:signal transduction histidine kinase
MLLTTVLWIQSAGKELEIKKKNIQELFVERDVVEEFELSSKESGIKNDRFVAQYLANPYLLNIDLNERVLKNLGVLNKNYIINIYAYDFDKNPIKGTINKTVDYFEKILKNRKTSKISNNFYHVPIMETGEKYIGKFEYTGDTTVHGFLYIELIPRVFKVNSAYPELLSKNKTYYDEILKNYSYAIYQNKKLMKSSGEYQYATYFNFVLNPNLEYTQTEQSDFSHLIYPSKDKIVVVSEPKKTIWIAISIFSFIVLNLLILFIVLDYFGFSYDLWIDTKIKDFFVNDTLQKQIQNYTILLLLFSLSILALITFIYFNYQYKNIYKNKIEQNTNIVVKNFKQLFSEYYPVYGEETYQWVMLNRLQQRSDIFETDITAYNVNGDMIATSNPEIYKNSLISRKMDADAFFALNAQKKSKFINEETIGKLHYLSLYLAITSDGDTKLYLQFPHYNIDKYLRSEIILFLISLINIYVLFLVLIAFAAVFLSKSITNSLIIISEHIKNVDLNKKNRLLEWNKQDEIGVLVKQYNNMLQELERSAQLLAKSEREGAWSEMAKQVAHDIKNPLTPMKLKIQHLQRALMNDAPDIKELIKKTSEILIEQIDHLANIASDFSEFAKVSNAEMEEIDFMPVLQKEIDLFSETENITIHLDTNILEGKVFAAKSQLMRLFTNIIKNAIQAIPDNKAGIIDITVRDTATHYTIAFKDNGEGIPADRREKIFEPNFTTKSSGTGLGLAICKRIIDRLNGNIYLESKENEYTVFYVELPK